MANKNYFICFIDPEEFTLVRQSNSLKADLEISREFNQLKARDQVLFAFTYPDNEPMVMAEYEVTKRLKRKEILKVVLEPIYNAPPHNGIKMNSLTLAKLALTKPHTGGILVTLTEQQFETLAKMLTN